MLKKNIVLIGFAGCGKTTVGVVLSRLLNVPFYDSDTEIVKSTGESIPDIFSSQGESTFREIEKEIILKLSDSAEPCVISTGGGCVKSPENISNLKENGVVVHLMSTPEKIYSNIKDDESRPLLKADDKLAEISKLMGERAPLYEEYADITVDVSGIDAEAAAKMICASIFA